MSNIFSLLFGSILLIVSFTSCASKKVADPNFTLTAYISKIGLDSISKTDLLEIKDLEINMSNSKYVNAIIYVKEDTATYVKTVLLSGTSLSSLHKLIKNLNPPIQITFDDITFYHYDVKHHVPPLSIKVY